MLLFGHTGISVGITNYFERKKKLKFDLRLVALLAILPDLIDKPPGILFPSTFGNNTRLYAHTLLASIAVYVLLWIYFRILKKESSRVALRKVLLYGCIYLGHMFLDRFWDQNIETFLWPILGGIHSLQTEPLARWMRLFSVYNITGELIGAALLWRLYLGGRIYPSKWPK